MPAAGLQDVGHAAVATGSGALKLHSFVKAASAFLIKKIRPRQINDRDALNAWFHSAWKVFAFPLDAHNAGDASGLLTFGTALKGAFPRCRGTDHLQPVMILSEELATCTYPSQRFRSIGVVMTGRRDFKPRSLKQPPIDITSHFTFQKSKVNVIVLRI